jgi:hypothetical protein
MKSPLLALRALVCMIAVAIAGSAVGAERWVVATITSVYPLADGSFVLTFSADSPNCTNGNSPKYYHATVGQNGVTIEGLKGLLAVSLAAATQGKTVNVAFDDATAACYVNRLAVAYP